MFSKVQQYTDNQTDLLRRIHRAFIVLESSLEGRYYNSSYPKNEHEVTAAELITACRKTLHGYFIEAREQGLSEEFKEIMKKYKV